MREVLVRAFSGLLYVALLLLAIFSIELGYQILMLIFGTFVLYEFLKLIEIKAYWPYIMFFLLVGVFCFARVSFEVNIIYLLGVLAVNCALISKLFSRSERVISGFSKTLYLLYYITGGVVFTILLPSYKDEYTSSIVASVFGLIWINDTFAFVVGKSLGKTKLLERISPKKTVEGFLGGMFFSVLASIFIFKFTQELTVTVWVALAVITSTFGTMGDLIQSQLKRQAGVKDSGSIMPGHGGIFDRLDSMIFAAPFLYTLLIVLHYVS